MIFFPFLAARGASRNDANNAVSVGVRYGDDQNTSDHACRVGSGFAVIAPVIGD